MANNPVPNALHEDLSRADEAAAGGSDRGFGMVFGVVSAGLGLWSLAAGGFLWPAWLTAAALFGLAAALRPTLLAPLNRLWTAFGLLLHRIVSPLVLAVLFFLVVTPIGLMMRLSGKDPLNRRFAPAAASYWIERRPPGPAVESVRDQF